MIRRVVVGISGGVDSSVAGLLLRKRGFDVQGVFMKNWDIVDEHGHCSGEADWEDAQWVCQRLKIPLVQVNFVKEYWNDVFGKFLHDYEHGLTPNPDILCNRYIKFNAFYEYARQYLAADAIATGHYARTSFGNYLTDYRNDKNIQLLCARDKHKDQTFFLSQVPQRALRHCMFPLADLLKDEVKSIACEHGLERIARKRESTGICFVGKRNFTDFIAEYIVDKPGDFIDFDTGAIIGRHMGFHHWTIGQRCRIAGSTKGYFVLHKLAQQNAIVVSSGTDHLALYSDLLYTDCPHWIGTVPFATANHCDGSTVHCTFRFQHTKPRVGCVVFAGNDGRLIVKLAKPLRALTPGQYAVFYRDDECLGSAQILQPGPSMIGQLEEVRENLQATGS